MSNFLTDAGPLVWPILALEALAILYAVLYARSTERRHATVAVGATTSAGILALLSVATGFQLSIGAMASGGGPIEDLYLVGLAEAFNGIDLALLAAFFVAVLVTIGSYRRHRGAPSEKADGVLSPSST